MSWLSEWSGRSVRRATLRGLARAGAFTDASERRLVSAEMALLDRDAGRLAVDDASWSHLRIAAGLLASYRVLAPRFGERDRLVDLIGDVFLTAWRRRLRWPTRALLALSRDRFAALVRLARSPTAERRVFGAGFDFSHRDGRGVHDLLIRRCLYHDYFTRNGAPELTRIVCRSDHAWIDEIDPARHGVRFERPATIGTGGAQCVFRFVRDGSSPDEPRGNGG